MTDCIDMAPIAKSVGASLLRLAGAAPEKQGGCTDTVAARLRGIRGENLRDPSIAVNRT